MQVMAEVPAEPAQTAVLREEDEKIAQDLRRQQMQEFLRWRQEVRALGAALFEPIPLVSLDEAEMP